MQSLRIRIRSIRSGILVSAILLLSCAVLCGCSAISVPDADDVLQHPLGTESIKIGMTKQQVESIWGKPDSVKTVEDKEKWQNKREVWTYSAQYRSIPLDAGYLSKTKKLYFDGENLTEIGD
ncbi:MAG: outer membrane protein assembly factor BamE [Candidatus Omnitrophota bacterium]|jgi:hypothetical protein